MPNIPEIETVRIQCMYNFALENQVSDSRDLDGLRSLPKLHVWQTSQTFRLDVLRLSSSPKLVGTRRSIAFALRSLNHNCCKMIVQLSADPDHAPFLSLFVDGVIVSIQNPRHAASDLETNGLQPAQTLLEIGLVGQQIDRQVLPVCVDMRGK